MNSVRNKWVPEIQHYCPKATWILVGTKADLRDSDSLNSSSISTLEGQKLADELGAAGYYECSARTGQGVKNVFDNAIRQAMRTKYLTLREQRRKNSLFSGCNVM